MRPLLIYIHGFQSSSQSQKAAEVRDHIAEHKIAVDVLSPTFANYPEQAYQQVVSLINEQRELGRDNKNHRPCARKVRIATPGSWP